jgi:hypothetical protein
MAGTPTTGSLASRQELRYFASTQLYESFTAADNALWAYTAAIKLRLFGEVDDSGLVDEALEDTTIQTRLRGGAAPLVGRSTGPLKFKTPLGGGNSGITVDPTTAILRDIMGNVATPTAKTATVIAGSTTTTVNSTGIGAKLVPGSGVLIGTRGDGYGGGVVRPVQAEATDAITLGLVAPGVPQADSTITLLQSIYFDEAASDKTFNFTWLSKAAAHQRQAIGAVGSFTIEGLKAGEKPTLSFEFQTMDHQWVDSADRTSLTDGSAGQGNDPPTSKALGGFWLGENASGATACTAYRAGAITITPNIAWEALEDPNGPNGIGGWIRNLGKPRIEVTIPMDADMPGLYTDFTAGTYKKILFQLGTVATGVVAFYARKACLVGSPVPTKLNNEMAIKCTFECHDDYDSTSEILSSALVVFIG